MKLPLRIASLALALAIPASVFAAPPANATGLSAETQNGGVLISWDAVPDQTIAYYRVYYSAKSILDNNGAYDDFEVTPGPENVYLIKTPPSVPKLYIAVLAVNASGEESDAFEEEASITFAATTETTTPSVGAETEPVATEAKPETVKEQPKPVPEKTETAPVKEEQPVKEETKPRAPKPLELLSATAVSATGVLVKFSADVSPEDAQSGLAIVDASGASLSITRIEVKDATVTVHTQVQEKGKVYELIATAPLMSIEGGALAEDQSSLFTGHSDGVAPRPSTSPTPQPQSGQRDITKPADVADFRMDAQRQSNGRYTVVVQWRYDNSAKELAHYIVRQSRDGGKSYGKQDMLPVDIGGVRLQNVDPGTFGISVQTVNVFGYSSTGVFRSLDLPAGEGMIPPPATKPRSPVTATVTPPAKTPKSPDLSDSGTGSVMIAVAVAGAVAGWKKMKTSRVAPDVIG